MTADPKKIRLIMELRRLGIKDTGVLSAIERIPRDRFVPPTFRDRAFENIALPIHHGQTISQPYIVAFMTEALELNDRCKVLEIGTGSGYQAAILSRLCRRVYTIERFRSLMREAEQLFHDLHLPNITTRHGDGGKGWPEQAPFDRIIGTAAAARIPSLLIDHLAPGGVMVMPVGSDPLQQKILRIRKDADGEVLSEDMITVRFVPMVEGLAREG